MVNFGINSLRQEYFPNVDFCKQMDGMIAKMTDAAKKKEATMRLDMSKAEIKQGNEAGCMKHMEEAHKALGL
jgi:hypothetical protein